MNASLKLRELTLAKVRDALRCALDEDSTSIGQTTVEELRAALLRRIDSIVTAAEVRGSDLLASEARTVEELRTALGEVDATGTVLQRRARAEREAQLAEERDMRANAAAKLPPTYGGGYVRSEPTTYSPHNVHERSFFADAYAMQYAGDQRAAERIARHSREVEVERRDITTSTLNGLVPPVYLLDRAVELARAMRPFADAVPSYELPPSGMSVVITRMTTGTATAMQTSQNTGVAEQDLATTDLSVLVNTLAGQQDVSRQALERGAVTDELIFADLVADYATRLDAQILTGTGSNGQHKGYLTCTAQSVATYTSTTVAAFYGSVATVVSGIASNRYAPADVILMHPRRWAWLLSKSDSDGRPLVAPTGSMASNPTGVGGVPGIGPVGTVMGLPVIVDANIPTNLGSSTDEDTVIVTRLSDLALWEQAGGPTTFRFDQAVNAPATIRLAVMGYSAWTAERYPTVLGRINGSGLAAPAFG